MTGLTSLPLPRRCLPASGPNAGSKLPECCRACGQCHQTLSSLSCTWDAYRPPRGILESWSYSIWLATSKIKVFQTTISTAAASHQWNCATCWLNQLQHAGTGQLLHRSLFLLHGARTRCHHGCIQCSNEWLRPGKSLVLVCRTASLHEDWNMVMAVMALKDSGWLVITQNDYNDIPMLFLVPPKNKRASLGVNVVCFSFSACEAIGSCSRHFDGYCFAE